MLPMSWIRFATLEVSAAQFNTVYKFILWLKSKRRARTEKSTVDEAGERPSGEASSDDIRKHATMIK